MTKRCAHCGQEIPERRLGIRLSPLKAKIFDLIQRAGKDGIEGLHLFYRYGRQSNTKYSVMKCHIYQINEKLVSTDYTIDVTRNGRNNGIYRLKRTQVA
jgi:hypothetical protein